MLFPRRPFKFVTIGIVVCIMSQYPEDSRVTRFPRSDDVRAVTGWQQPAKNGFTPNRPYQEELSVHHSTESQPPKRPMPPLPVEERLPKTSNSLGKRQATAFCKESSPWITNQKFAILGTSGTTYLSQRLTSSRDIVVIREHMISESVITQTLIPTSHMNVVKLKEAFVDNGLAYIVYEQMEISLPRLRSCVKLYNAEIATICKEVSLVLNILLLYTEKLLDFERAAVYSSDIARHLYWVSV